MYYIFNTILMEIEKDKPIWKQIVKEVKGRIVRKEIIRELPAVRAFAEEIRVNPNTVARAYRELEREGVVESWVGRGTWVKEGVTEKLKEKMIKDAVDKFLRDLISIGLSKREIKKIVRDLYDRD
ncbi:MAG: GntR family transcriptional regulator [candidate division WOR-3 bacterium]